MERFDRRSIFTLVSRQLQITGQDKGKLPLYNSVFGFGSKKLFAVIDLKTYESLTLTLACRLVNISLIYSGVKLLETLYINFAFLKTTLSVTVIIFITKS